MSENEDVVEISISMPIDSDGFLRRECPTCEREFKWIQGEEDSSDAETVSAYHCPYCNVASEPDSWFTQDQLEFAQSEAASRIMDPMLQDFVEDLEQSDFISVEYTPGERVESLGDEPNDMRRVDFECHPSEPIKVAEDWDGKVHCLVCGKSAEAA